MYKYIEELSFIHGGSGLYSLRESVPVKTDYFIEYFWMPIKKKIGKKLSLVVMNDQKRFQLVYNILTSLMDRSQYEINVVDFKEAVDTALSQIDTIMTHFYSEKEEDPSIVPFFDPTNPIKAIVDENVMMTGRLPMVEEAFIAKYWKPLIKKHHEKHPGTRFRLQFLNYGTIIAITAECCKENVARKKMGLKNCNSKERMQPALNEITCDLADCILQIAEGYNAALIK